METIRTWKENGFELTLKDTYKTDRLGKSILAYDFWHNDELIFEGEDYCCSPLHCIDSDESIGGLLGFLSLKPGDTDDEYFEDYTPKQLEWANMYGEELSMYAYELCGDY